MTPHGWRRLRDELEQRGLARTDGVASFEEAERRTLSDWARALPEVAP